MFRFTKKKPLLFYKYILSYLIIFLIPFTTISIIFYYMSISSIEEEIISSNIAKLEQVREVSDARMKELRDIATKISYDHRLTPYALKEPYSNKVGVEQLTSYQISSSFIDSLFLVYHEEENIYSPKGTGTLENAMNNIYPFKEEEKEEFREVLMNSENPSVHAIQLNNTNEQNLVSYIYPIPPNSVAAHGAVVFFVQDATISSLMDNILGDFNGNAYIFNSDDQVIVSKDVGDPLDIGEIKNVTVDESGVVDAKVNKDDYAIVTVESESTGFTFITAMPTAQFYEKMSSMKTTILIMLFLIALLGVAVTIYLSLKQYQPIQKLSQFLKQKNEDVAIHETKKNEFEKIKQTIEFIYEDSEKMQQKINKQQPRVRAQFLLEMLEDNFRIRSRTGGLLDELQIKFPGNHFFVMIISFNEKISAESIEHREEILKLLSEVSYKDSVGFGTELFQENAAALIVSMPQASNDNRKNFAIELQEHLQGLFEVKPTIGVGTVYEGMNLINRSFIEAAATIEHNRFNDKRDLIYFEDITDQKQNPLWYSLDSHVQFTQSLKRGDKEVASEALRAIMHDLKEKNISSHMLKCMCFDVVNSVLKVISNLSLPINIEKMNEITEFTTIDELENKIQQMIETICENVDKRIENHSNHLRDSLLLYIDENFTRHDLSLAIIAEEFELSMSYLSRFIKEHTGSTFTQYVWKLRSALFKKQLINSDAPIKDIVTKIGYVDVANFTRKFKAEEGLTPGQYRKRYFDSEKDEAL